MRIFSPEQEQVEYWDSVSTTNLSDVFAYLVSTINEWADGIEIAGTAKQMRYPAYDSSWYEADEIIPDEPGTIDLVSVP